MPRTNWDEPRCEMPIKVSMNDIQEMIGQLSIEDQISLLQCVMACWDSDEHHDKIRKWLED